LIIGFDGRSCRVFVGVPTVFSPVTAALWALRALPAEWPFQKCNFLALSNAPRSLSLQLLWNIRVMIAR